MQATRGNPTAEPSSSLLPSVSKHPEYAYQVATLLAVLLLLLSAAA
jgi:hypothetical protein